MSCKTSTTLNRNEISEGKERKEWIFAFMAEAFHKYLKSSGFVIEKDASSSLNFQILGDFNVLSKTDSLGKNYSKVINDKAIGLKSGDLDGYKAITNGCLSFFESKELDSIANLEYRKIKLNEKKLVCSNF